MTRLAFIVAATAMMFATTAFAQQYDLVIKGGRVMDPETKLDAVRNVGISNGRIEVVTESQENTPVALAPVVLEHAQRPENFRERPVPNRIACPVP